MGVIYFYKENITWGDSIENRTEENFLYRKPSGRNFFYGGNFSVLLSSTYVKPTYDSVTVTRDINTHY